MEARAIVRQAMAILTPAVPARMEDGHQMLTHWTRKIIVEEGHTVPQLVHILHLIVQHFKVCEGWLGCTASEQVRFQAFALRFCPSFIFAGQGVSDPLISMCV